MRIVITSIKSQANHNNGWPCSGIPSINRLNPGIKTSLSNAVYKFRLDCIKIVLIRSIGVNWIVKECVRHGARQWEVPSFGVKTENACHVIFTIDSLSIQFHKYWQFPNQMKITELDKMASKRRWLGCASARPFFFRRLHVMYIEIIWIFAARIKKAQQKHAVTAKLSSVHNSGKYMADKINRKNLLHAPRTQTHKFMHSISGTGEMHWLEHITGCWFYMRAVCRRVLFLQRSSSAASILLFVLLVVFVLMQTRASSVYRRARCNASFTFFIVEMHSKGPKQYIYMCSRILSFFGVSPCASATLCSHCDRSFCKNPLHDITY